MKNALKACALPLCVAATPVLAQSSLISRPPQHDSPSPQARPRTKGERPVKHISITALATLAMLLGGVTIARAADATCGNQTISNATIDGNLKVTGPLCFLFSGVTVSGNVSVAAGAVLRIGINGTNVPASSPINIDGNITTAAGCAGVGILSLSPSAPVTIGGNVRIEGCRFGGGVFGYDSADGGTIKIAGNFVCTGNTVPCSAETGSVSGNLTVTDNGGRGGGNVTGNTIAGNVNIDDNEVGYNVTENTIGGNLSCTGNTTPFTGTPNTVQGHANGQC